MPQLGPMSGRSNVAQKIRQNFGADQDGAINSDDAIALLHILLDGISDPSERAAFVGKLSAFLDQDAHQSAALDARRGSGRRPAQDSAAAVRALNSRSFAQRWPDAASVRSSNYWRP